MKGIACLMDISQAFFPLPRLPDSVWVRDDSNLLKKSKLFSRRSQTVTMAAANGGGGGGGATSEYEIRVCGNKTCRRQGSMETLETLIGIAPPHVAVKSCGCLGRCGAGPNLVVLPQAAFLAHCGTAARAADIMSTLCGGDSTSWTNSLEALALRKRADQLLRNGNNKESNASEAEFLLSQAINLKPLGGVHVLFKDRSAARLLMGSVAEALEDAKEALTIAPKYPEAYICQGDVLMTMDQFDAAEKSYAMALELDPSIRRSKSFKARIAKLQDKLIAANLP